MPELPDVPLLPLLPLDPEVPEDPEVPLEPLVPLEPDVPELPLAPGSDLTSQPQQVVAIATAIWTPDVVAAYTVSQELSAKVQILKSK